MRVDLSVLSITYNQDQIISLFRAMYAYTWSKPDVGVDQHRDDLRTLSPYRCHFSQYPTVYAVLSLNLKLRIL